MSSPFPIDPVLTGITLAYRNQALIADEVLPRLPAIGKQEFKYTVWNKPEHFTIPNTRVGRKSEPTQVEFTADEKTGTTEDYGLDDMVPNEDLDNAGDSLDPLGAATEGLTDLVLLDREKRVADTVFDADTYPSGNKVTLSGTDQWSDHDNSAPIDDIMTGLDTPILRPNIMTIGQAAWTQLRTHPDIVKAVKSIGGDTAGVAARAAVAELFELEEILVGQSFLNTAKPGQTASYSRVWGKHCALLHRNRMAQTPRSNRVTFGFTVPYGTRVAGTIPQPKVGLRGSQLVRVGESVVEVITASDVGYFLEDVAA